jgi:hypothetical protein
MLFVTDGGKTTCTNDVQTAKAYVGMLVTTLLMVADASAGQSRNAAWPKLVTESGITTDTREDCSKAPGPMKLTESGIVIDNSEVQRKNANSPMLFVDD